MWVEWIFGDVTLWVERGFGNVKRGLDGGWGFEVVKKGMCVELSEDLET